MHCGAFYQKREIRILTKLFDKIIGATYTIIGATYTIENIQNGGKEPEQESVLIPALLMRRLTSLDARATAAMLSGFVTSRPFSGQAESAGIPF